MIPDLLLFPYPVWYLSQLLSSCRMAPARPHDCTHSQPHSAMPNAHSALLVVVGLCYKAPCTHAEMVRYVYERGIHTAACSQALP